MSTEAKAKLSRIVQERIEDGPEASLPVADVVEEVAEDLSLEPATVDNYVRWYCTITNINNERHILSMKQGEMEDRQSTVTKTQSFADHPEKTETEDIPGQQETEVDFQAETDVIHLPVGSRTDDDFEGLPVLEDINHPLVPDVRHTYYRREQIGGTTDMENICDHLMDPDYSVLLIAEHGTGKDFAILTAAARTNRPVRRVNFGAGTTFEDLVGLYAPKPDANDAVVEKVKELSERHEELSISDAISVVTGASSQFSYQVGVLTECVLNGGIFLGDEINAAGGDATMPLHGITEAEGARYLHLKPSNKVLTDIPVTDAEVDEYGSAHAARVAKWDDDKHYGDYIHPEFKFVGTMNPPTYSGTKPLNDAFKSRFWPVTIDYLEPKAERRLLFETTPLDDNDPEHQRAAEKLTKIAQNLRQSYKDMDIVTPIGHREIIKIGKLVPRMGAKNAAKYVLTNIAQAEDKSAISDAIEMEKF